MVILEFFICVKFRHNAGNNLEEATPLAISISWSIILTVLIGYYIYLRFFYKWRVGKFGEYLDKRAIEEKKANKKD